MLDKTALSVTETPSFSSDLFKELGEKLAVFGSSSAQDVLAAAFDWYYIPRSDTRCAYADRVVRKAASQYHVDGSLPDWLYRVYERRCGKDCGIGVSVAPPPDPQNRSSPS